MMDKFQKLFGPNPARSTSTAPQQAHLAFEDSAEDLEHKKRIARIKNKRRILGLLALAMFVAAVAPSVLSPNDYYADRGAKLEIPGLEGEIPAKVVPLNPPKEEVKVPVTPTSAEKAPAAASLSSANKVAANAKPAHPAVSEEIPVKVKTQSNQSQDKKTAEKTAEKPRVIDKTQKAETKNTRTAAGKTPAKTEGKTAAAKAGDKTAASASAGPLKASANGRYFIQVIATSNKDAATRRAQALMKLGVPAYTEIVHRRGSDLWRVRVGRFMTQDEARRALDILALNSIENGGINQERPAAKKN